MSDGKRETLKEKKVKPHASYTALHFECHLGSAPKDFSCGSCFKLNDTNQDVELKTTIKS